MLRGSRYRSMRAIVIETAACRQPIFRRADGAAVPCVNVFARRGSGLLGSEAAAAGVHLCGDLTGAAK